MSCKRGFARKYHQEAVVLNFNDIDKAASVLGNIAGPTCDYTVQMVLKALKKGSQIKASDNGSSIKGFYAKSKTDPGGYVQYLHQVQLMILGADTATRCILDKLDHGRYVVAVQLTDGTVEIYGWENGLSTADYTWDITEGGGGSLIVLQSDEDAQESMIPLVYKPQTGGDANADFNEQFEQP